MAWKIPAESNGNSGLFLKYMVYTEDGREKSHFFAKLRE